MNELPEQDAEDLYSQYLQQQPVETQQEGDDLKEYLLEIEERLDTAVCVTIGDNEEDKNQGELYASFISRHQRADRHHL